MTIQAYTSSYARAVKAASLATILAATAALALAGGANAQMQRAQSGAKSLATVQGGSQVTPVPCNSVSSCNQIISYCAEKDGTWVPGGASGPEGQPASGTCYLD